MSLEADALPHGWRVARLGAISDITMGQSPPSEEYNSDGKGLPFLQGKADFTEFSPSPTKYCTRPLKVARQGSVLISVRAPVGDVNLADRDYIIGRGLGSISLREGDNHFLFYLLLYCKERISSLGSGTTFQQINRTTLDNFPIQLPSLPEQRAIARALRAVQEAKEARRRELALERERKAALMHHLFTHGTRGEPTMQTEIGEMPEGWEVVELGEVCKEDLGLIQTGPFGSQLHASDYKESGIPVVNPTHMGHNVIIEERLPFISREDADRLSKHYLKEGDILIARRGDFSHYSYVGAHHSGWLCGTGCLVIRLQNPQVDNYFLSVWIGTETAQLYLNQYSVGMIMPNLNTKILQGLPVLLPPIDEQQQMARALKVCDSKIAALEWEATVLDELFRAVLEELMTGRLRAIGSAENS